MSTTIPGPRHRTDGAFTPSSRASFWWNSTQNPKPSPVYSPVPGAFGMYREMDDVVVDNFRERSRHGEIFSNPMSSSTVSHNYAMTGPKFSTTISGVTYYGELLGGYWLTTSDYYSSYGRTLPDWSSLMASVRTAALAAVKPPSFNGLVSLGELGQTLRYLKNPFATGMALAGQLQRNVGKAARLQRRDAAYKEGANLVTQFMYGVRPMIREVSDFLLTLQDTLAKAKHDRQTFRAADSMKDSDSWSQSGSIAGGSITFNEQFNYTRDITIRAGLLYEYSEEISNASKWGLTVEQIPDAAWQLVPLSFVVNWFVNVDEFIRALTPVAGAKRLAEWTTFEMREKLIHTASGAKFGSWSTTQDFSGADSWERVYKNRIPSVGNPNLHFKDFSAVFSDPDKLLGMSALIIQRLQGAQRLLPPAKNPGKVMRLPQLYTFS